jgi:hypothetical protein
MDSRNEIASVTIEKTCMKTMPCQHNLTVKYKDGTELNTHDWAPAIARKYGSFFDERARQHFGQYLNRRNLLEEERSPSPVKS